MADVDTNTRGNLSIISNLACERMCVSVESAIAAIAGRQAGRYKFFLTAYISPGSQAGTGWDGGNNKSRCNKVMREKDDDVCYKCVNE